MKRIKKIIVSYKGYPNLNAEFKTISAARMYCDKIYTMFGIDMMCIENYQVVR